MSNKDYLIFVSYRGSDEMWGTELVFDSMKAAFGEDAVFKAGNSIPAGERWKKTLLDKAKSCPVMLVCIGPGWLTATASDGSQRIYAPDDWVRREIETSKTAGNIVVPVLLGDDNKVKIPPRESLPESIRDLFDNQARRLVPGGGLALTLPELIESLTKSEPELAKRRRAHSAAASTAQTPSATGRDSIRTDGGDIIKTSGNVQTGTRNTQTGRDNIGGNRIGGKNNRVIGGIHFWGSASPEIMRELLNLGSFEQQEAEEQDTRATERPAPRKAEATGQYVGAVELLTSDKGYIREAGVHELERIALGSAEDHAAIMHVLNSYADEISLQQEPDATKPPRDVTTAIMALGKINREYEVRPDKKYSTPQIIFRSKNWASGNFMWGSYSRANFNHTDLSKAWFLGARVSEASFASADLSGASFSKADLRGADLSEANLSGANFIRANFRSVVEIPEELDDEILEEEEKDIDEAGPVFPDRSKGAHIAYTQLTRANLTGADLSGADLAMVFLLGADLTNAKLVIAKVLVSYLIGAKLRNADLTGADLRGAKFSAADFDDSDLDFIENSLHGDIDVAGLPAADFTGAKLTGADFTEANLANVNLTGAYLIGARLQDANLTGADLRAAKLRPVDLTDDDLVELEARGVDADDIEDLPSRPDVDLTGANLTGALWDNDWIPEGWMLDEGSLRPAHT